MKSGNEYNHSQCRILNARPKKASNPSRVTRRCNADPDAPIIHERQTMPYSVVRRNGRWCVIKDNDGTLMGCHDTPREAYAQITAIEAAEGTRSTFSVVKR